MTVFTKRAVDVFAPATAGGAARGADMGEAMVWGTEVERANDGAAAGRVDQSTWAGLVAITGTRAGQPAIIYGPDAGSHTDPVVGGTVANVGEYYWSAAPAGWRRAGNLQRTPVHALNTGAGTANAVQATSDVQFSAVAYAALITVNFVAANTGAVTLSIDGETPRALVTNTGDPVPSGYVKPKMSALVQIDSDGNYRLFSYGDATAVQAAAEAALAAAEDRADAADASADRAESYAAMLSADKIKFKSVGLMITDETMSYTPGAGLIEVGTGDIIEAGGFRYEVAAVDATDHHRATAGGVKLYVLDRRNFRAWGPSLAGNDDGPLMQKAVDTLTEGEELDLKRLVVTVSGVSVGTDDVRVVNGKLIAHSSITANAVIKAAAGTDGVEFENLRVEVDKDVIAAEDCAGIMFDQCANGKAINCRAKGSRNDNYAEDNILGTICGYLASDIEIIGCKSFDAHREGIMGHKCDRWKVIGGNARDSGYSNIGTSGGTKAQIIGARSSGSGSTGITVNSIDSLISGCTVDTNALNHGILIGHLEDAAQYAQNCLITGNRVIGTAGSGAATGRGVSIVYGINCLIADNVITDVIDYGIYFIPHPTEPGGCVIIGNTVDGCTHGIYAYGAGTGSLLAATNTIRNASVSAVGAFSNGEISIIENILTESAGGVNAGGHASGSTLTGDGITLLKVDGNTMRNIGMNALSCRHLRGLSFSDNILENINTSNSAFAHVVNIQGTNGGTASRMPTTVTMNGNSTKGTSTSSKLVNIEANTYGDGVVTLISANDNVLPDLAPSRMFGGAGAGSTAKMSGKGNQIGTDDRFLTVTLLAASTSLTIANSNICPGINGLPVVMPTNANWPSNVRFSIVNGSVTLNYSAPASNATAYMQVA